MNLPNKLTISRFVLTGAFLAVMFSRSAWNDTLALIFFSAASLTDFLDGRIARARHLITNFGVLMDPLADKILTCSAFIALAERHAYALMHGDLPAVFRMGGHPVYAKVEAWMVIIIVARELGITGLRLLAASKNVVLAAEGYGKHKTISQIAAIIALLVMNAYGEWWPWLHNLFSPWTPGFALVTLWLTVLLTATSGVLYLWRNRQLYLNDL
ncbi:MAG TPA: CDP-alcohol phosphatidyltransferase family protein [Verrucomicrobiota bacterium]|nr:CDP-alcohol phosphatidyltransferase family protein [Verrucomicrobiota bacterium]HNT13488.1 CDP-alcohol phosphatidyltransferase family protein [Verrucomicrobiota bacterium]